MTPNKLPPLPERDDGKAPHDRLWDTQWVNIVNHPDVLGARDQEEAVHLAVKMTEQNMAENYRALRQSQSLPAGAVAYDRELIASMLDSAANGRTGYKATSMREQAELLRAADNADGVHTAALQADAREKGESPSLNQIPKPCAYPPVDSETGADTGSCCHHAYADGWNECRDEAIRLATQPAQACPHGVEDGCCKQCYQDSTQPAQASEPWVGVCRDEHCADIGTVHDYCRPLALGPSTHPQPVTPAGGEVEPRTDRQMLLYLDYQFAGESWVCGRCGNEEPTNGCDSHIALQRHLYTHPPVADAALVRDAERYRFLRNDAYECVVPHGAKVRGHRTGWITHIQPGVDFDSAIDSAMQDAALNQRGGGE